MPRIGDSAPGFDVAAHDGTRVRLADLSGHRVLLWFYPEADTPG
jgi:thioredoxin-dependent peroxiredoxin